MAEQEPGGLDRELVCVLFPGVVKNDDKALQCLGGLKVISQVLSYKIRTKYVPLRHPLLMATSC